MNKYLNKCQITHVLSLCNVCLSLKNILWEHLKKNSNQILCFSIPKSLFGTQWRFYANFKHTILCIFISKADYQLPKNSSIAWSKTPSSIITKKQ